MKNNLIFIEHMLESINNIEEFTKGLDKEKFAKDKLRQSAVLRQLEVIGEAVKNISQEFRDKHKAIEWQLIAGLRDKLIHHYFGVDITRVWNVIEKDLPILKKEIEKIKFSGK